MKNHNIFLNLYSLFTALVLFTFNTQAEIIHWPNFNCEKLQLTIENKSSQDLPLWLQERAPQVVNETAFTVKAKNQLNLYPQDYQTEANSNFTLIQMNSQFVVNNNYLVTYSCQNFDFLSQNYFHFSYKANSIEGGQHIFKISDAKILFQIQNLFYSDNNLNLSFLDHQMNFLYEKSFTLKKDENYSFTILPETKNNSPRNSPQWIIIKTQERSFISAFKENIWQNKISLTEYAPQFLKSESVQLPTFESTSAFFKVEPKTRQGDSFVVEIKKPELIQKARAQVANPKLEKILFAKIQLGSNQVNLNLAKPEHPYWSWSVSEVTNISDIASTECNGFPQLVEDHLEEWLNYPTRICFWNYRITEELHP